MSEEKTDLEEIRDAMDMLGKGYDTSEPAAVIHPPKTVHALSSDGLIEHQVWGWVKVSANFIHHIRKLRGAKLSIWQVLALAIDERGECKLTIKQLCALSGYSHTEVIDSIKELEEWGYLSVKKNGKSRIYTPEFAARGEKSPAKQVKKLESSQNNDSSLQEQDDSSPSIENSASSIRELKELKDILDGILEAERLAILNVDKSWRGRELLPEYLLVYGDWWHSKTKLHFYGKNSKPKMDKGAFNAFNEWYEDDLTISALSQSYDIDIAWKKIISKPAEITAKAKAIQANGAPLDRPKDANAPVVTRTPQPIRLDEHGGIISY